jgi:hypothetical protein
MKAVDYWPKGLIVARPGAFGLLARDRSSTPAAVRLLLLEWMSLSVSTAVLS